MQTHFIDRVLFPDDPVAEAPTLLDQVAQGVPALRRRLRRRPDRRARLGLAGQDRRGQARRHPVAARPEDHPARRGAGPGAVEGHAAHRLPLRGLRRDHRRPPAGHRHAARLEDRRHRGLRRPRAADPVGRRRRVRAVGRRVQPALHRRTGRAEGPAAADDRPVAAGGGQDRRQGLLRGDGRRGDGRRARRPQRRRRRRERARLAPARHDLLLGARASGSRSTSTSASTIEVFGCSFASITFKGIARGHHAVDGSRARRPSTSGSCRRSTSTSVPYEWGDPPPTLPATARPADARAAGAQRGRGVEGGACRSTATCSPASPASRSRVSSPTRSPRSRSPSRGCRSRPTSTGSAARASPPTGSTWSCPTTSAGPVGAVSTVVAPFAPGQFLALQGEELLARSGFDRPAQRLPRRRRHQPVSGTPAAARRGLAHLRAARRSRRSRRPSAPRCTPR